MKKRVDIFAVMQNIPAIMGLEGLVLRSTGSGDKWQGRYYINGQPHPWKKDKLRVWAYNGSVMVGEQGGETMSIQKWLVQYGGCADFRHAYEVLDGSRARLDLDIRLVADRMTAPVGRYVDGGVWDVYSRYGLDANNLYNYFCRLFGTACAWGVFNEYRVTSDERHNTVYWYIDIGGNICHDKVMRYKFDGHRDKTGGGWRKFTTADGYTNRCYFGAHLLDDVQRVYVVEGEKTAMMCRLVWPDKIFIATGGKNQLRDMDTDWVLLPDIDAIEDWGERGRISRWWEMFPDVDEHSDLGDMVEMCLKRQDMGYLHGNTESILENY